MRCPKLQAVVAKRAGSADFQTAVSDKIAVNDVFVPAVEMKLRPRTRKNLPDILGPFGIVAPAVQNPPVLVDRSRHVQGRLFATLYLQRRYRHF